MTEFYKFAGEHPALTFFLALLILQATVYVVRDIAYAIRGEPKIVKDKDDDV